MKKFIQFVCLLICSNTILAQNAIQGTVNDSNNMPIEYFRVTLLTSLDSIFVKGGSFINGEFKLQNLEKGSYILDVSSMGYSSIQRNIEIIDDSTITLSLTMKEDVQNLSEVQIVAKRPTVINKGDRYIVNVKNTFISDAGNVVDALHHTPFIIVDDIMGKISVAGKESAMILINGKKVNNLQELKMTTSQAIKQIEVIENPSAKYEAEGQSIINIITSQKKKNGLNVNLRTIYEKSRHSSGQVYSDITYAANKFVFYSKYAHTINNKEGFNSGLTHYEKNNYIFTANKCNLKNINKTKIYEYALGFNYYPNKYNFFSFKYSGNNGTKSLKTISILDIIKNNQVNPTEIINNIQHNTPKRNSVDFNYKYQKNNIVLGIMANYTKSETYSDNNIKENDITNTYVNLRKNNWNSIFDIYSAQYDFKLPFKFFNSSIEFGSKYSKITSNNESFFYNKMNDNWEIVNDFTNKVNYSEKIIGSYVVLSGELNKKVNYSIGIRHEHSTNKNKWGHGSQQDYITNKLFPSLLLNYTANKEMSFRLSYSKRIKRPAYKSLNNSVWYINSFSTRQGNPYLQPTIYNNLSLSSKIKKINTSINVSFIENPIDLLYFNDSINIEKTTIKYANTENRWSYSLNLSSSYHYKFWSIQPFFSISYMQRSIIEDNIKYTTEYPGIYLRLNNQFDITNKMAIDFNCLYNKPGFSFKEINDQFEFNLAFRTKLLDDKLSLRMAYKYIPTKWKQILDYSYKYIDFTWDGDDRNMFTISLKYNFSTSKKNFKSKTSSKNELNRMR